MRIGGALLSVVGCLVAAVALARGGARTLSADSSALRPITVVHGSGSNEGPAVADRWFATVNLGTRKLSVLPRPFNAEHRFEWRPSLSGPRLLYGSIDFADQRYSVVLANLRTHAVRVLGSAQGHAAYAAPGQVNGRYATWINCPDNRCIAYRYDIETTIQMPPVGGAGYWHFGPSVTADGTVYFGVGKGCANVRLIRWRNGRTATIYRFPAGKAFLYSYTAETIPPTIYYDEVACSPHALSSIDAINDTTR